MHWFFDPTITVASQAITKEELRHLGSLRIRAGESIVVTDGRGAAHQFELIDTKSGTLRYQSSVAKSKPNPTIHLVQALAKGDRDELALQASVELGVDSVTPWQAELSISNWNGKEEKARERWQQIAIAAMKQSQQSFLPGVRELSTTAQLSPRGLGIVLLPEAEQSILELVAGVDELTLVVGPEGGISKSEVAQLVELGFKPGRLGPSVLRTSTAGPAAIAAIQALSGAWVAQ